MTYGEYICLSGTNGGLQGNPYVIKRVKITKYKIPLRIWDQYKVEEEYVN